MSAERGTWVSLSLFNILISNLGVNSVFMKFTKILNWEEVAAPVQEQKKSTERFGKRREKVQNRRIMFGNTQQMHLGMGGVLYIGDSLNNVKSNSVSQDDQHGTVHYSVQIQTNCELPVWEQEVLLGGGNSAPSGNTRKATGPAGRRD